MDVMAAVAVFVLVLLAMGYSLTRSRQILEDWAAKEGYHLRQVHRAWLWRGPFWLRSTDGHHVFRVQVEDEHGRVRSGYARVGGWFLGIWSDEVAVKWDEGV